MPAKLQCEECRAIIEELNSALAGDPPPPERRAEMQANLQAFWRMLLGSEQAEEEVFSKLAFRAKSPEELAVPALHNPKVRQVWRRLLQHTARTGHLGLFQPR